MNIFKLFWPSLRVMGFLLALLTLSRVLLVYWYWDRVEPTGGLWFILQQGVRFDIVLMGLLLGPAFLAIPWLSGRSERAWKVLRSWLALVTLFVVWVEMGTVPYIDQYDARPNYIYVEYLKYPREVFSMLLADYAGLMLIVGLASFGSAWLAWWMSRKPARAFPRYSRKKAWLITALILIPVVMMIRSTLDHRPVNPSTVAFSTDSMVNLLPLNSPYTLMYAIYEQHRDSRRSVAHAGSMDDDEVMRSVIGFAGLSDVVDMHSDTPSMHLQTATRRLPQPMNLVIILEESLGAEFVGSLGGKDLTPNLDALADEGIWFEKLFATGTRSARGIEAVITGFPPTAKRSVVKLGETQENFFTLAALLQNKGYRTSFLYGGEAHFDNMRRFFVNNGFETIIDEKDYENPQFVASWGVSDEDLFELAHEEFSKAGEQPFFSLVFTSSNHKPFDIPAGKVTPESGPAAGRDTAVKYADYALGKFFEWARPAEYFKNTVFLVVSDHNSRVYGDKLIPIKRFHVPGVILGGGVQPRRIAGISSQIDLFPTLLSLIGVDGYHPGIGYDLTTEKHFDGAGRAQIQFHDIQGWVVPGKVIVQRSKMPIKPLLYDADGNLTPDPAPDQELIHQALAHALWPGLMIRNKAYRPHVLKSRPTGNRRR